MGHKTSSGGGSGGGGGGTATLMGLHMIQCGRQTVHVNLPDGQVRQFVVPVQVSDLLHLYPHNYVSHVATSASGRSDSNRRSSAILPFDAHLETGNIYMLLPLPRLFPSAPPPSPHLCACFFPPSETSARFFGGGGRAIKATLSKISPDVIGASAAHSTPSPPLPRRMWEPELEIIAEDRVVVFADKGGEAARRKKLVAGTIGSLRLR